MTRHLKTVAANPHDDRLDVLRTWSITLGISAFLLTVMYASAVVHYGAPHFADPDGVIAELSQGGRI
jgi:hypothetical protein